MNFVEGALGLLGGGIKEKERTTLYFLILLLEEVAVGVLRGKVDVVLILINSFFGCFFCFLIESLAALFFPDKLIRQLPNILALLILVAFIFNK